MRRAHLRRRKQIRLKQIKSKWCWFQKKSTQVFWIDLTAPTKHLWATLKILFAFVCCHNWPFSACNVQCLLKLVFSICPYMYICIFLLLYIHNVNTHNRLTCAIKSPDGDQSARVAHYKMRLFVCSSLYLYCFKIAYCFLFLRLNANLILIANITKMLRAFGKDQVA